METKPANASDFSRKRLQQVEDALELHRALDKDVCAAKWRYLFGFVGRHALILAAIYCWYFGLTEDLLSRLTAP